MSDRDQTTAADQRGPNAPCQEVGLSSLVKERLATIGLNQSIKDRIAEAVKRKGS